MITDFYNSILQNDEKTAVEIFRRFSPDLTVIEELIMPAMIMIGELWEAQEISLSQIYLSSRIVERLVYTILPAESAERRHERNMAIASLEDYHLMGKNIVLAIIRAAGYSIHDFGRITADDLQSRLLSEKIDILLISTLMLPSALRIGKITSFIKENNLGTSVIVGGAPFNFDEGLSDKVGADVVCKKAQDVIQAINTVREKVV